MIVMGKLSNIGRMMACALAGAGLVACDGSGGLDGDAIGGDASDDNGLTFTLDELTAAPLPTNDRTPLVVGGTSVTDLRYPFMAAAFFRAPSSNLFSQGCGGSLIADRWVMSAAHCVTDAQSGRVRDADEVALVLGAPNLNSTDRIVRFVSSVTVHPEYNRANNRNDIALLELSEPVSLQPITLSNTANPVPNDGEIATVAGWGATSETGGGTRQLQETDLPIVSTNACQSLYGSIIDGPSMVCAGGARQDACFGDSGGPLFVTRGDQFIHAGVVSFGFGCARPGLPAVYARTSTQFNWINSVVGSLQAFDGDDQTEQPAENGAGVVVHISKRNASNFAIEGAAGNGQNIFLGSSNPGDVDQQWVEIDRGNGFYSYQRNGTNFCMDGGNGGASRQNVSLSTCASANFNQTWQKESVGSGAFRLVKSNASGFVVDGGNRGANGQNVRLFDGSSPSQNLQWFITPL